MRTQAMLATIAVILCALIAWVEFVHGMVIAPLVNLFTVCVMTWVAYREWERVREAKPAFRFPYVDAHPTEYVFKGWDWSELGECWGIPNADVEFLDEEQVDELEKAILAYMGEAIDTPDEDRVFADLDRFLDAVIREESGLHGDYARVFTTVKEVQQRTTKLQFVAALLRMMWT